jgi:hypothetical protein
MGFVQTFEAQQASGTSTSSYIDLGNANLDMICAKYVTMSTGHQALLYACDANSIASAASATFYPVQRRVQGLIAGYYESVDLSTNLSGGKWGFYWNPPFRFIQFVTTDVVSGGVSYTVVARGH